MPVDFDGELPVLTAAPAERFDLLADFRRLAGRTLRLVKLRIMGRFDGAYGRFMYHCHLLEHEDMGMMRPFVVMPPEALEFDHGAAHGGHGGGHTA